MCLLYSYFACIICESHRYYSLSPSMVFSLFTTSLARADQLLVVVVLSPIVLANLLVPLILFPYLKNIYGNGAIASARKASRLVAH